MSTLFKRQFPRIEVFILVRVDEGYGSTKVETIVAISADAELLERYINELPDDAKDFLYYRVKPKKVLVISWFPYKSVL